MVHHKIKLKEMKRDRFRQAVFLAYDQSVHFLKENVRSILIGVAVVAVLVIILSLAVSYMRGRAADARADLARALQLLPNSSIRSLGDSPAEADLEEAGEMLAGVVDEYGNNQGGALALYYLSLVRLEQGRPEEAADAAARFVERNGSHRLAPLAMWTEARAQAQLGRVDEAVAAYERTAERDSSLLPRDLARFYLAGYLESLDRKVEALDIYRALAEGEDSAWKVQSQRKVDQIEPLLREQEGEPEPADDAAPEPEEAG